jgi:PilZ domain
LETYVVRIYRYEKKRPRSIVGIVEEVGGGKKREAFTSYDELWSVLKSTRNKTREPKKSEASPINSDNVERRNDVRSEARIPVLFPFGDQNIKADIMNVSQNGIGIMIAEKLALSVGNVVDFRVRNCNIRAKVRWVDHNSNSTTTKAGFQTIDGALNLKEIKMAGAS